MKKIIAAAAAAGLSLAMGAAFVPASAGGNSCAQNHAGGDDATGQGVHVDGNGDATGGYISINDGSQGGNYAELTGGEGGLYIDGRYDGAGQGGVYVDTAGDAGQCA